MKQIIDSLFQAIQSLIESIIQMISSIQGILTLVPTALFVGDLVTNGKVGFINYALEVLTKIVNVLQTGGWEMVVVLLLIVYLIKK